MTDILTQARAYVAAGLSILPIRKGTKQPDGKLLPLVYDEANDRERPTWAPYESRLPYPDEVDRWFSGREPAGIGIIGGAVSGGLCILDLESWEAYAQWRSNAELLVGEEIIVTLPIVQTGKGYHIYYRTPEPGGNRKLAMQERQVIAETRGEGGYVLAPPTLHPDTRQPYTCIQGNLTEIPHITDAQARALLDAGRALAPDEPATSSTGGSGESVIDRFNQETSIETILERHHYRQERVGRYIRPGGERSSVVIVSGKSLHYNTNDPLYAEAPGGKIHAHTAFSAFCTLEHNGEVKRAVKAAAQTLGMQRESQQPQHDNNWFMQQAGRVLGLVAAEMKDGQPDTWPYFIHEGGMWMHRTEKDGSPKTPLLLTNFTAQIVAETEINNGEDVEQAYTISATCGKRSKQIDMARKEFESEGALARILAALGARARINPTAGIRYIMDAIKAFSRDIQEHTVYTHTGWIAEGYLFSNGYVDAKGWHPATTPNAQRAHLPKSLERYRLNPPAEGTIQDALIVLNTLLHLAPDAVMLPLLGAVWLAPIQHTIGAAVPLVHLYAPTGSHKTALTCAVMSIVGEFVPDSPTDTWTSTHNYIQRLGWHLKDTVMLLDDFKRAHIKPEKVTQLVQNYGDGTGKGRLNSYSEVRATYPIRGVLVSSGEDQPEGEASTLARILSIDLPKGVVDLEKLTRLQTTDAPYLHILTIDWLQWLLQRESGTVHRELHQSTRAAILAKLREMKHATNPGRVASNVAALYVAWSDFCRFLLERRYWTQEQVDALLKQVKAVLFKLAQQQLELTTNERASNLFIEAVQSLLASGKAVLFDSERTISAEPGQTVIGIRDRESIYLIAETTYNEVCKATRATGGQVGYTKHALGKMLQQDGILVTDENPTALVVRRRINSVPAWCWCLKAEILEG